VRGRAQRISAYFVHVRNTPDMRPVGREVVQLKLCFRGRVALKTKSPSFPSKEWAIAAQDIISVTQPPFKRPVVLRPILSNSLPLSVMSFSTLEELSKIHSPTSHIQTCSSAFLL